MAMPCEPGTVIPVSEIVDYINENAVPGDSGPTGATGPQGNDGAKGDQGDQGIQGDPGIDGTDGEDGTDGTSVTIKGSDTIENILLKPGVVGDMWISTNDGLDGAGAAVTAGDGIIYDAGNGYWITVGPIQGPEGEQGVQGDPGIQGPQGDDGLQGETGVAGSDGLDGAKGDTGDQGPAGIDGNDGAKGDTGEGVAIGGTTGQVLSKASATDYDTEWSDTQDISGKQDILQSSYTQNTDVSTVTTHTIDYATGDRQEITLTGDTTLSYSGFVAGRVCVFIIDAVNWGSVTVTYPAGTLFGSGTAPTLTATGKDVLVLEKDKDDVYSLYVVELDVK